MLTKAKNDRSACDNTIVKKAYDAMIENYENTIIFLKSYRKSFLCMLTERFMKELKKNLSRRK